ENEVTTVESLILNSAVTATEKNRAHLSSHRPTQTLSFFTSSSLLPSIQKSKIATRKSSTGRVRESVLLLSTHRDRAVDGDAHSIAGGEDRPVEVGVVGNVAVEGPNPLHILPLALTVGNFSPGQCVIADQKSSGAEQRERQI